MDKVDRFLRRSLKGEKDSRAPHHASVPPKSASAINPPLKVIKALYSYTAKNAQELSFTEGQFLYVIGRANDEDWYEANDPSDKRSPGGWTGLVPVNYFEVFDKQERGSKESAYIPAGQTSPPNHQSGGNIGNGFAQNFGAAAIHQRTGSKSGGSMIYGIVQYDFKPERPDELEAKAGEAIVIIAQSDKDWYVAKPIGRLGGPGLIPVTYVEIRDMLTGKQVADPKEAVRRAGVPKVEEWKQMAADYKNSSISLGRFESRGTQNIQQGMERMCVNDRARSHTSINNNGNGNGNGNNTGGYAYNYHQRTASQAAAAYQQNPAYHRSASHFATPVAASIPTYRFETDTYWYVIEAIMDDGSHWELSRTYTDFYDFQIRMLNEFRGEEAGDPDGNNRTLPYMPGPVTYVTDAISNGRRENLDKYLKELLKMPPKISRCYIVKELFAPREGDFEPEPANSGGEYRYSGGSQPSFDDSRQASRQSSNANFGEYNIDAGQSALSPRPVHQQNISAEAAVGGAVGRLQPPDLLRQDSALTAASANSQQSHASNNKMVLKVRWGYREQGDKDSTEIRKLLADPNVRLQEFLKHVQQTFVLDEFPTIGTKDGQTAPVPITNDYEFDLALQRPKVMLDIISPEKK